MSKLKVICKKEIVGRKAGEEIGCLLRGSELDTAKAAMMVVDDFRNGRLGKITLEFPEDYE